MNSFFEIQFVEDQEPFFQLGQLPVYKLRCTRWEYSSENLIQALLILMLLKTDYQLDQLQSQMSSEDEAQVYYLKTLILY